MSKLTTTATGRAIHRVVDAIGPQIKNADGSEPAAFISRSVHRTTQVITSSSEYLYKKGAKMMAQPLVDAVKNIKTSPPVIDERVPGGGGGGSGW